MRVGIVGFGKMGQAVWQLVQQAGFPVTVVVRRADKAREHQEHFRRKWDRALRRRGVPDEERIRQVEEAARACRFTHRLEDLKEADLVLENVPEDETLKKALLRDLEDVVGHRALLLTNTSSLSIEGLAECLCRPERFCGFHFFYPTALIPLVEIIPGSRTGPSVVEALLGFSDKIRRRPIVVRDGPGSIINGILVHYYAEAVYMLEEGAASPRAVDEAAREFFYVGPLESIDVIGLELLLTGVRHAPPKFSANPIRMPAQGMDPWAEASAGARPGYTFPALFAKLVAEGRMGKAAGRGIFRYDGGRAEEEAPEFYRDPRRRLPQGPVSLDGSAIGRRLFWAVLNGCLWALHLGLADPEALDVGVREVLQMDQGPISWMRRLGREHVVAAFRELALRVGARFAAPIPQNLWADP